MKAPTLTTVVDGRNKTLYIPVSFSVLVLVPESLGVQNSKTYMFVCIWGSQLQRTCFLPFVMHLSRDGGEIHSA